MVFINKLRMPEKTRVLRKSTLKKLSQDPVATAKAIKLVYVSSKDEGIERIKVGKGFKYIFQSKTIKDKATLQRIRSLVIPPAWREVWICRIAEGHLQATGLDVLNRKQYRYHPMWNELKSRNSFMRQR